VTQQALQSYFSKQDRKSQVVVEATGNWMYLYETIEQYVPQIVLAHPRTHTYRDPTRADPKFKAVTH
jgi:hypothetical protein